MTQAFDWAKKEALPAMKSILEHDISGNVNPLERAVGGQYQQAIEYVRLERDKYVGEVGKRDGNYIFHFFPRTANLLPTFGDILGDAMVQVFKISERLSSKHDEVVRCYEGETELEKAKAQGKAQPILCRWWGDAKEFENGCPNCGSKNVGVSMSSWAVKASGFALNPMGDELAARVFDVLDRLLS